MMARRAIEDVHGAELIPEDRNGVVLRDFRGLAFPRLLCCWEAAGTAFHVLRVAPTLPASDGGVGDGVRHLANGGVAREGLGPLGCAKRASLSVILPGAGEADRLRCEGEAMPHGPRERQRLGRCCAVTRPCSRGCAAWSTDPSPELAMVRSVRPA